MRRPSDPLAAEIARLLVPIVAPAAEKGELLIEELALRHPRLRRFAPKGLGEAVRRLRAQLGEAEIRAGAQALLLRMKRDYGLREDLR